MTAEIHRNGSLTRDDSLADRRWTDLVQSESGWVRKCVAKRISQPSEVDDVTQEVLLSAISHPPADPPVSGARPWLYRILVRRVADYYRHRSLENRQTEDYLNRRPAEWGDGVFGRTSTDGSIEADESRTQVRTAMEDLPTPLRTLLELKFESGWSYRRLAEYFQTTERTIEYRLIRAKQSIRRSLSTRFGGWGGDDDE